MQNKIFDGCWCGTKAATFCISVIQITFQYKCLIFGFMIWCEVDQHKKSFFTGKMNSAPGRLMLMDKIQWRNGWPIVGVPSDTPKPAPSIRKNLVKSKQQPRIKSVNSLPLSSSNEILNTVSKKDFKSSLPFKIKSSVRNYLTSDQTHFVPSTPLSRTLSTSSLSSSSSSPSSGKKPKFRTYTIKQPNKYYLLP